MTELNNDFEREKLLFTYNCEQFRHMNSQLNQIPLLAVTLTGGLWYATWSITALPEQAKFFTLIFAGACNFGLVLVLWRVRIVMEKLLLKINEFSRGAQREDKFRYFMVSIYSLMLLSSAIGTLYVACKFILPKLS